MKVGKGDLDYVVILPVSQRYALEREAFNAQLERLFIHPKTVFSKTATTTGGAGTREGQAGRRAGW